MAAIVATGGLDELAMAVGEAIIVCILLGCAGLVAFSWWKRSLVGAVVACILVLGVGALLQPWGFIAPPPPSDYIDALWLPTLRVVSAIWALAVIVTGACLVSVIRHRKLKTDARDAA